MPTKAELGKRVREERLKQSLTLKAVENLSGLGHPHFPDRERHHVAHRERPWQGGGRPQEEYERFS